MLQITQEIVQSEWVCLWNKKNYKIRAKKHTGKLHTHKEQRPNQQQPKVTTKKERNEKFSPERHPWKCAIRGLNHKFQFRNKRKLSKRKKCTEFRNKVTKNKRNPWNGWIRNKKAAAANQSRKLQRINSLLPFRKYCSAISIAANGLNTSV